MKSVLTLVALSLLLAAAVLAQTTRPQVSLADIKMLAKAGISEQIIISQIRQSGVLFRLTTAEILDLKESGVPDKVIDAMLNSGNASPTPPSAPPAAGEVISPATVVPGPPPPVVVEEVIVSPGPGYVWVPGCHVWTGYRYTWVRGHWARPPYRGAVWVPGRFERRSHRGGIWIAGHWR